MADQHFFAANIREWQVNEDCAELIRRMQGYAAPFLLWVVPAPITATYEIELFQPVVEGAKYLGLFEAK